MKVTLFGAPDKSDPLNLWAVVVAEALNSSLGCAQIVKGRNGEPSATGTRFVQALAAAIAAKPNQRYDQAEDEDNVIYLD